MKKTIKKCLEWASACFIAFFIVNAISFLYERQPGWLNTPNGASAAVREPNAFMIHGKEGYSFSIIDNNGYTNPNKPLANEIILMMGSSHTQGKEIAPNKKYSVLVNDYYQDPTYLHTYNIACDASYLPTQINHFNAAIEAYPNAKLVTIEIFDTDYSVAQIERSLAQVQYDSNDSAKKFDYLSPTEEIMLLVKDYFPMLVIVKNNIDTIKEASQEKIEPKIDIDEYKRVISKALSMMRKETDIPIVFLYHPAVYFDADGTMKLKYSNTWETFSEACRNNGIDIIDTGEEFLSYYQEHSLVPYGFFNTTLGTGHLNEVGHKIIADEIIRYLEGQE